MYAVTVTFQIKPDQIDDFLSLMMENARASVTLEPGCQQFDVCHNAGETSVFLYELYDDRAAFEHHMTMDHFAMLNGAVDGMVIDKTLATFDTVQR